MLPRLAHLLIAGLAAVALAGCSGGNSVTQNVNDSLGLQGGSGRVIDLAAHHYQVGDVSGTALNGSHLDIKSLRGKVVVVNFWGSWCDPCIAEADGFAQVAKDYAGKGVAFLGIDERDHVADALHFERAHHVTYPSIFDGSETLALQFPHAIPASTPTTVVIGRNGDILAKVTGVLEYTDLKKLVEDTLDGTLS